MRAALIALLLALALPTGASELRGMYDPKRLVETFSLIGPARLGIDQSGTVHMIYGEVQSETGEAIHYQALFMMCNGTEDACANVLIRHDWSADKADIWCAIETWKSMPDYKGRAHAAYAFDKVRLIREQFGFEGASVEPQWKFVQLWRKELQAFHALTQALPSDCE